MVFQLILFNQSKALLVCLLTFLDQSELNASDLVMFYLNTIEQLFLFVEQLDQLEVCLPFSRLLAGLSILAVFQNLKWNANKTFLGENAPKNFLLFDLSILKWYEWVFSCAKITVVPIALLHSSLDIGNCCNDILLVSDGYIIIVSNLKQKHRTKMIGFVIFYLILSLQSTPNAVLRIYILALPLSHEIGGLL